MEMEQGKVPRRRAVIPAEVPPSTALKPMAIGQQVTVIREFKGPRGTIRIGTSSIIEGHSISGGKIIYKIIHRGFRFWVPAGYIQEVKYGRD